MRFRNPVAGVELCGSPPIIRQGFSESWRARYYRPSALDAIAEVAKLTLGGLLVSLPGIVGQTGSDIPEGEATRLGRDFLDVIVCGWESEPRLEVCPRVSV